MKKVLFWDFDGTLVYSNHLWSGSAYRVLKQNMPENKTSFDEVRAFMRAGFPWHTPDRDFTGCLDGLWWEYMYAKLEADYAGMGVEPKQARLFARQVREEILNPGNYLLYEDTLETLKRCMQMGYHNYVLSNNYPELAQVMEQLGLLPYFEEVVVSARVGYDKPRREIFDYARRLAGMPEICYMIGDNPAADILGAARAGMPSMLVHRKFGSGRIPAAAYEFERLESIPLIL